MENYLLEILCVPALRPQDNSQGKKLTQTGQSFWAPTAVFFSPFPPSFCEEVKVESFFVQRMAWTLTYAVLKQTHYSQKLWGFFFS